MTIARETGELQIACMPEIKRVEYKDNNKLNIVTQVDRACEKRIVDFLRDRFPTHDILAEEGSNRSTQSDWLWIVDPLDGTVNYFHSYPLFAVSMALRYKNETVMGVVYEPNRDEMFVAEKGGGALLNDKPIRVTQTADPKGALFATGFAYNVQDTELNNLDHWSNFILNAQAVRRDGVAAADLCYVACGRFDGFWEFFLKPWDIAAGVLILEEAGGKVTMMDGSPIDIFKEEIVASNTVLHEAMLRILAKGKKP